MSEKPVCPRCDGPIADTAYVCSRCARALAATLRDAAQSWPNLQAMLARQTVSNGSAGAPKRLQVLHGPTDIPCHHDSCLRVRKSQLHAMWTAEPPIPGETNVLSTTALENAWIVNNTATAWARTVHDESGHPIPRRVVTHYHTAPPAKPKPRPSEPLCTYLEIPLRYCGGGHPHPETT